MNILHVFEPMNKRKSTHRMRTKRFDVFVHIFLHCVDARLFLYTLLHMLY